MNFPWSTRNILLTELYDSSLTHILCMFEPRLSFLFYQALLDQIMHKLAVRSHEEQQAFHQKKVFSVSLLSWSLSDSCRYGSSSTCSPPSSIDDWLHWKSLHQFPVGKKEIEGMKMMDSKRCDLWSLNEDGDIGQRGESKWLGNISDKGDVSSVNSSALTTEMAERSGSVRRDAWGAVIVPLSWTGTGGKNVA